MFAFFFLLSFEPFFPFSLACSLNSARFSSIAWGPVLQHQEYHPMGLIASGMSDGVVSIWDANQLGGPEDEVQPVLAQLSTHEVCSLFEARKGVDKD